MTDTPGMIRYTAHAGTSHPLCLTAVGVLLVNDHLLKAAWPGVLTGKLSDVAWLVVAPVVTAALLARSGMGPLSSQRLALSGVGFVFVLLQLWPALGEAWGVLSGGHHVADGADLLALPALLLARLCWTTRSSGPERRWALPVAALACLATDQSCFAERRPGDGVQSWDPNEPLLLSFETDGGVRRDTVGVRGYVHLRREDSGEPIELGLGAAGNFLLVCPLGGLEPDTRYVWTVEPHTGSNHHHYYNGHSQTGTTTFLTASSSNRRAITSEQECQQLALEREGWVCDFYDTGTYDTGADDTGSSDTGATP
jgi:hypothetical protein